MARRTIVIGYNGTPQGEDALGFGRVLGEALDAQLSVAVVAHLPRGHGEDVSALDDLCGPLFAAAREKLGGAGFREHTVVEHSVARGLYQLAEELSPAAIVLGSARHGGIDRVMLGSAAGSLLTGVPCSLAVAPLGYADSPNRIEKIGVAVDGSGESWRALHAGANLARETGGRLRVLTVAAPHHYALGGVLSPYGPEEYERMKEREDEKVLAEALERLPEGVEAETALLHGDPADALPEAAADLDALLLGSRGYGPLKGALLGSVSAKLIGSSPCPVLVVPRGSGADPLGI